MPDHALPRRVPVDPGLSSEFHRWPLPGYLWPALEKRSQSIFCTEAHLRIHGALTPDIEAWVQRRDGCIAGLWLFRRLGRKARVINEVASAGPVELEHFADALFARYRELDVIELHALHLSEETAADVSPVRSAAGASDSAWDGASDGASEGSADRLHRGSWWPVTSEPVATARLWQRATVSEDFVLALPSSIDDWYASLSSRTREKLRQYLRRAHRSEPALSFRVQNTVDISERDLRAVLQMSRARMRAKGRSYGMDPGEERRLCALMRERGQLATIAVDGRLRAGLLCTLAGNDLYMHVIAHDPAFDALRLGYLCCVMSIEAAIAQRLRRFHFLWGWYDYKVRLGGRRRELEHALLWRSRMAACRHPLWYLRQQWRMLKAALREQRLERQQAQARQAAQGLHGAHGTHGTHDERRVHGPQSPHSPHSARGPQGTQDMGDPHGPHGMHRVSATDPAGSTPTRDGSHVH